ncbi:MAG: hypothetical protein KAI47_16080 [Deltaproteobacteria bacterium]|nr:hypothetical protein [Deltaproteobacteria bacterium]
MTAAATAPVTEDKAAGTKNAPPSSKKGTPTRPDTLTAKALGTHNHPARTSPPTKKSLPPPAWAARLARPCRIKHRFAQELRRLLAEAAAHASQSSACKDGPGLRVTVDQIKACRGPRRGRQIAYHVRYRVTHTREGDTRGCGRRPGDCSWTRPVSSTHYATNAFPRLRENRVRVVIPKPATLSGLKNATPLDKPHNGGCYGKRKPFRPHILRP